MTDPVLTGLMLRRADLAGEADALRARLAEVTADLGHLDAVIRMFDPERGTAPSVRPERVRIGNGRADTSRAALDALRGATEPVSTADLARRVMQARGLDSADALLAQRVARLISEALARQREDGTVRSTQGPERVVLWEVVR
jgi:hypothetical protein